MSTPVRWRSVVVSVGMALLLSLVVAPFQAAAHPGLHPKDGHEDSLGVRVNSPEELAGFFPAVQWGGTAEVDGQTAEFVYAGTGCTPASYAAVADRIQGNIALVDSRVSATNPADRCPAFTFLQKVRSAQHAGAIGFVQIPGEGEEPRSNATAVSADIPALEVERTDAILAVRDAAIAGTPVNVTFTKPAPPPALSDVACVDGQAGPFPCDGIDLLAFVPQEQFDGAGVSDIWGWTDPETGDEYVMLGKTNGTAFFRVTDPTAPVYLGALPNPAALQLVWHDVKVYENHAFIVSESEPHGMTVFDLTRLRGIDEPQEWDADAHYRLNWAAHNIAINTETGFAYIVGGNVGLVAPDQCLSGLHMVDIRDPKNPTFAGCYLEEGGPGTAARSVGGPAEDVSPAAYVHDTECVVYRGPDARYEGREICFNAAEDGVVIADVTDKLNPVTLSVVGYPDIGYTHQGSLTADQGYLVVNDELDETEYGTSTRTLVFDVRDLRAPTLHFEHFHETASIDHNNYVHEGRVYQSNYTSGLRVLDASHIADGSLEQVAFFDTYPASDDATFDGTWSNYPYFASGTIAVSGREEGLFLLRLADDGTTGEPAVEVTCVNCPVGIRAGETGTAQVLVTNTGDVDDTYTISVDGVPDGWTASAAPTEVSLAPGESADVAVDIEVPQKAKRGAYSFTVTATSSVDPAISGSDVVEVEVRKGRPSDPGRPDAAGSPDQGAPAAATTAGATHVLAATGSGPAEPVSAAVIAVGAAALWIATKVRRRRVR